ncbi:MAG: flagellar basal body rod protein FlgB [Candidatus Polarisedimenticolaceae bacterium]|nr:flagellar basal body rod protein FlgB [Candidatus Polarisedimenticolaceae bacterium]
MKLDQVFGIHEQALQLRARRAELLAGNLANADTPGYKARDIDFQKALRQEMGQPVKMAVTHERHVQVDNGFISPAELLYRVPSQPSLDGNTVDSQLEYAAFSSNALEYQASLRFLTGKIDSLKSAIRGD